METGLSGISWTNTNGSVLGSCIEFSLTRLDISSFLDISLTIFLYLTHCEHWNHTLMMREDKMFLHVSAFMSYHRWEDKRCYLKRKWCDPDTTVDLFFLYSGGHHVTMEGFASIQAGPTQHMLNNWTVLPVGLQILHQFRSKCGFVCGKQWVKQNLWPLGSGSVSVSETCLHVCACKPSVRCRLFVRSRTHQWFRFASYIYQSHSF